MPDAATVRIPSTPSIPDFLLTFPLCILAPFLLQGLRFVAALRDGRPRAALPVHCVIPDAMDAEPPQSYHPDSSVSKSVDVAVPGNHQTIIFLCPSG